MEELMQSHAGRLLKEVLDLDFALEKRFQITLDEVDCEMFRALQILQEERNRYLEEQSRQQVKQ